MESDSLFVVYLIGVIIGLLIWAAILDAIIRGASRSSKIELQLKIQTALLAKIADKHGVPDSDIQSIVNPTPVKKKSIW